MLDQGVFDNLIKIQDSCLIGFNYFYQNFVIGLFISQFVYFSMLSFYLKIFCDMSVYKNNILLIEIKMQ